MPAVVGCRGASARRALDLVAAGQSYREVGLRLGISKNTVLDIVKRDRANQATITDGDSVGSATKIHQSNP